MTKTDLQISNQAHNSDTDSPAVLAYRMGQVELAVREGFAAHDRKLDMLTANFMTKEEALVLEGRVVKLEHSKAKDWIWKTLSAAAGATLAVLILYALTNK